MPSLPHEPQTIEEMKARWPQALEFVYDAKEILNNNGIRPGECRSNVFDFESGLRVIASVEKSGNAKFLHLSASFGEGTEEYKAVARFLARSNSHRAFEHWARTVTERMVKIGGKDVEGITFLGMTQRGVPHWRKTIPNEQPSPDEGRS